MTFEEAQYHSSVVAKCLEAGGNAKDCVALLVEQNIVLTKELLKLSTIAPKKIKLTDGRVMVWHCPDELIPFTDHNA